MQLSLPEIIQIFMHTHPQGNIITKVTATDVAKATGYSKASVYAALKDSPHASRSAKKAIQQKAFELGFTIDPILSQVGKHRWKGNGLSTGANIIFFMHRSLLQERASTLQRLKTHFSEKGYSLSFVDTDQYKSIKQANREFEAQGIRGIVSAQLSLFSSANFLSELDVKQIAIIGGELNRKIFHTVTLNWTEMISRSIKILIKKGYKKISIIIFENEVFQFYDEQRIGAVLSAQRRFPIEITLHTMAVSWDQKKSLNNKPFSQYSKKKQAIQIAQMIKKDQPDAIISWSDEQYWILKDMGFSMPKDFGYLSLLASESSSGMRPSFFETWKLELDRVIELIRNQEFGKPTNPNVTLYSPSFIDRGTA